MRRACMSFPLALVLAAVALADKTDWTSWLSAKNKTYRDSYGFEHDASDFSYRWRLKTPCENKDCSFDLQLRNNSDRRESVNYTLWVEKENGSVVSDRDHRNFDPHEVQDVPVSMYGQKITGVKIE